MAELIFSRDDGMMYLLDGDGELVDSWDAGNNTTNPEGDPYTEDTHGPAPNGEWNIDWGVQERSGNAYGGDNQEFIPVGDYGKDGCTPSDPAAERGIGIHGGGNGPQSETWGCIRMHDKDIGDLADWMNQHAGNDPVDKIAIQDESALKDLPNLFKNPPPPPPPPPQDPQDPEKGGGGGEGSFGAGGAGAGAAPGGGTGSGPGPGKGPGKGSGKGSGKGPGKGTGKGPEIEEEGWEKRPGGTGGPRLIPHMDENIKKFDPFKFKNYLDRTMDKLYFIQNGEEVMKEKFEPIIPTCLSSPGMLNFALAATDYVKEWEKAALQAKSVGRWVYTFDYATQDWRWVFREDGKFYAC
jgi:hypothetical protein